MDAPDRQVRIAQAKIAAGAAHLLTSKEWSRIAERQRLEQESLPMAMTASEISNRARAAMDRRLPRFTAQEIAAANVPGTVPAEPEFRVRNIPGRGESTVVGGVPIVGGPSQAQLPVPQEGYGYVMGQNGYISTTPYGIQRGTAPVLADVEAVNAAPQAVDQTVQPAQVSNFQQQLAQPPVSMATGMKSVEELVPSLRGTPQRANETIADIMRGSFYGAMNVIRPSMWTSTTTPSGASAAIYTPERSPDYINQLTSRIGAMTDKTSPRAVAIQNEINSLTRSATYPSALTSDVLGLSKQTKPMTPETVASNILGIKPKESKAEEQQPVLNTGMTVTPVIPEGTTGITELEPQGVGQEMVAPAMEAPQYAQAPVYTPPQLQLKPFNVRQMMTQPSVSETLALPSALRRYQAETKAQIDAYKANVAAQRNAIRDSLDAQLKGQQLRKGELDIASRQIENQFASGGPQYGTFNIGDKTFGFIRTGPGSIQKIDLKPNQSSAELNYEFRVKANSEIAKRIKQGDEESAAIMYQSLGGKPEDFALFKRSFETVEPKAPADRGTTTAKASAAQRIRNPKTGEVRELRNGQWVKVQ